MVAARAESLTRNREPQDGTNRADLIASYFARIRGFIGSRHVEREPEP